MSVCWYLYIYICILTRNSDSTGSDPPPLSSVKISPRGSLGSASAELPGHYMAHSGIIGTGSESWCESQASGAVSCPSAWLSLLFLSASYMSSFCSPEKTLGEGSAPRHEQFYKNRFGLGCPALLSSRRRTEAAGAGPSP